MEQLHVNPPFVTQSICCANDFSLSPLSIYICLAHSTYAANHRNLAQMYSTALSSSPSC